MIYAKVVCDSVSPLGVRLSSIEVQLPRDILPQLLMHRQWSRSCESLRARPVKSKLKEVQENPFVPTIRKNQRGMQPAGLLEHNKAAVAEALIRDFHLKTVELVEKLADLDVAKEIANRYLQPYAYQKVLVTGTDFANFFRLRCDSAAQSEITELAFKMKEALDSSIPTKVEQGRWHTPYLPADEYLENQDLWRLCDFRDVSSARVARISYTNHDGFRDVPKDLELSEKLKGEGHSNPFEAVATPAPDNRRYGNLKGWVSYRYELEQSGGLPNAEG